MGSFLEEHKEPNVPKLKQIYKFFIGAQGGSRGVNRVASNPPHFGSLFFVFFEVNCILFEVINKLNLQII